MEAKMSEEEECEERMEEEGTSECKEEAGDENGKHKFNTAEWEICKRLPLCFRRAKNDVFITRKTAIAAQFKKCKKLLDQKFDSIVIHALGKAIDQALRLALMLQNAMLHSVKVDLVTGSVKVTDDLVSLLDADKSVTRQRDVSAVHIHIVRL